MNALELAEIPDYSTLQRTYKKLRMKHLDQMKQKLLDDVGLEPEEPIASDSTGFSPSQASLHYLTRMGRKFTAWIKGAYAVGTRPQFILVWRYGRGPSNDVMLLNSLRRDAARYGCYRGRRRYWVMLADSGFDGQAIQAGNIIPPLHRAGKIVDPSRKAMADLVSQARLDGLFGQR